MPVNYSESPVSVSEGNPPPPSRPRHKIPWWVFGLGCLVTAASIFLFSRLGISSSGSFSAIGDAEDSSFITPTAVPTSTPIAIVEKAGCLPQVTGRQTLAQACVSDPAPRQYSSVTLYTRLIVDGRVVPGVRMDASWDFKYLGTTCKGLVDATKEVISCTIDLKNATRNYTVMVQVKLTTSEGKVYSTTSGFTTEPEATVKPAGLPSITPLPAQAVAANSPVSLPAAASAPPKTARNLQVELPCIALEKFSLTYGSYKDNLGQKVCLEGMINSTGARIPGGAVHITFTGYADIEGIIPADLRVRFDKAVIEKLRNKKVHLHGTLGLSSLIKVPVLTVELPEQIEVIS